MPLVDKPGFEGLAQLLAAKAGRSQAFRDRDRRRRAASVDCAPNQSDITNAVETPFGLEYAVHDVGALADVSRRRDGCKRSSAPRLPARFTAASKGGM